MDEHYALIVDHLAVIQSQQQGMRQLHGISGNPSTKIDHQDTEEWSDDNTEDNVDGGGMEF